MVNSLKLDTRPRLGDLIEIEDPVECTRILRSERYPQYVEILEEHGLGIYRKPGDELSLWLGLKDPSMPEHCRWLFRSGSGKVIDGNWFVCEPENGTDFTDDYTLLLPQLEKLNEITNDMNRYLKLLGMPIRDGEWLMKYYQVFGESNALRISLLPQQPDWGTLHELFHHPEAWRKAHDVVDMPRDLLLRMHGLGPFLDHDYGQQWVRVTLPPE